MSGQDKSKHLRHGLVHLGHPDAHIPGFEVPATAAAPLSRKQIAVKFAIAAAIAVLGFLLEHYGHSVGDAKAPLIWVVPFALLLTSIAVMPFVARHWWEHNYARVSIALAIIVAGYYLGFVELGPGNLARALAEYVSFIFLLGSLFIVSGGILIRVRARATPLANTVLLLIGAIIANIFGTTGAAMLLIRPYLRMNRGHIRPYHVVFFIFVVANVGGSLTPIGDPPLFLGYLKGVPFFWVFEHCWPIWAVAVGALLGTFFIIDLIAQGKPSRRAYDGDELGPTISLYGGANLVFIGLVLAGVFISPPWRELLMAAAAFGSLATTPRRVHAENVFNYAPIREVALLFVGIFVTMIPALNYLAHASKGGGLPLHTPGQYYFSAGSLSSVLDNAPTYLTFLKTEMGTIDDRLVARATAIVKRPGSEVRPQDLEGLDEMQAAELTAAIQALIRYHGDRVSTGRLNDDHIRVGFLIGHPLLNRFLIAISMGAVLFGACTYIGNGPNFMVKSIAEQSDAPAPSFFGYLFLYAAPILLPVLLLVWLIFLR